MVAMKDYETMETNSEKSNKGDIRTVIDEMKELYKPGVILLGQDSEDQSFRVAVPKGLTLIDVQSEMDKRADARALNPRRATGTVKTDTVESFVMMVTRHASDSTTVFMDTVDKPNIVAVFNDHRPGEGPGWRDHRAVHTPRLSDEWLAWTGNQNKNMSQGDFVSFLEDRFLEVINQDMLLPKTREMANELGVKVASQDVVRGLAKGLDVKVDMAVKDVRKLDSGEVQVFYSEEHKASDGKPLSVPNAFAIGIPVFVNGPRYCLLVRLRYRVREGRVTWFYNVIRAEETKRDVVNDIVQTLRKELPDVLVVEGTP